jgi:hypothetical protein
MIENYLNLIDDEQRDAYYTRLYEESIQEEQLIHLVTLQELPEDLEIHH